MNFNSVANANKDTLSLAFGNIFLSYPRFAFMNYNMQLGRFGSVNLQYSFMSFLIYFGAASATYSLLKLLKRSFFTTKDYVKSIFNGKKFTQSLIDSDRRISREEPRYYAVIYGLNRGGVSFAKYLLKKGFNLILIDRDMQTLVDIENSLRKGVRDAEEQEKIVIHKLALTKFDQETLRNALIPLNDLPVKIFVNSKNSKRNARTFHKTNKAIMDFNSENGQGNMNQSEYDEQIGEELINRNEVFFSARENVEGFSALAGVFLYQMRRDADNPCLINIDNDEGLNPNRIKRGQILFSASLAFQDKFTSMIGKKFSDVKTINVKVNFKTLKSDQGIQKKLCENSFAYLGINDTIRIQ